MVRKDGAFVSGQTPNFNQPADFKGPASHSISTLTSQYFPLAVSGPCTET